VTEETIDQVPTSGTDDVPASAPPVSDEEAPTDTADDGDASERPAHVYSSNPRVNLTRTVFEKLKKGEEFNPAEALSLLDVDIEEFNALVDTYPNQNFAASEHGQRWFSIIEQAQSYLLRSRALAGSLARENSLWQQVIAHGNEKLAAGKPKFGEKHEGGLLTGEAAMMRMQGLLGLGTVVRIPLYHSGLWLSIKAPGDNAFLELEQKIANEKLTLGRQSNGLIFSNTSVYTTMYLLDFILDHVYEASFKYDEVGKLKSIIDITDIPTVLWGMLCATYPSGYQYQKSCVVDPTKCQHIVEELLNLGKLSWTDERRLSTKQRVHMARRGAKFTTQELAAYRAEHDFVEFSEVELSPHLIVQFRVPTIAEYQQSGYNWIESIVRQADKVFAGHLSGNDRDQYIIQQGQVTALRQYAHWVDKIIMVDPEEERDGDHPYGPSARTVVDRSTLEDLIAQMAGNDGVFKNFFEGVGRYIDNTTISLIALPKYRCPKCGGEMPDEERKHPHLIPLDMTSLFFTLIDQRISKVLSKSIA
jgi:hypothetical protein